MALLTLLSLSACGFIRTSTPEPTLAELEPVRLPEAEQPMPEVSLVELAKIYREVLAVSDEPAVRVVVLERLARLEMLEAEAGVADGVPAAEMFDEAIQAYSSLLEDNPEIDGRDQLLYQLSKAHDMTGNSEQALAALKQLASVHEGSEHYTEAQFRIGENHFSAGRYAAAEQAYANVVAAGESTPYYLNALYMLGWSQFKQEKYQLSIRAYTESLDRLMPLDGDIEGLSSADKALVEDCLRVLAVLFSYLDGVDSIAAAYDELGPRDYEPLLYGGLGELYLKQERYRDSAEAFRAFGRRHPDSEYAHRFHIRVIQIYERAGFRDLIVEGKREYVDSYSVQGDYFMLSKAAVQIEIAENLSQFIVELATHHHALAQAEPEQATGHYRQAADYYQLYVTSFPGDERLPEMGFLMAEARTAAGEHAEAVATFEWVAYEYPDYEKAADAGYAAVLGYQPLLAAAPEDAELKQRKVDSQIRFARQFQQDSRAPVVLNDAAASLLEIEDYDGAIMAASTLLMWEPALPAKLRIPAGLVLAHSYFEQDFFQEAASGYRDILASIPAQDERYQPTVERLAASLYRYAEGIAAEGDKLAAARAFERVMAEAPNASFRRQAQFDAAQHYMDGGEFADANRLLVDFQNRYPNDPLAAEVPLKLVYNHEQLGDWEAAARQLDAMQPNEKNSERAREMLYLSAEHYEKAGNTGMAIERYRDYAHTWEQPLAPRMEAMNKLVELYDAQGAHSKQRFWLGKIQKAHDAAGSEQTERSLYLAARSASVFAEDSYQVFAAVQLDHPIDKSLARKREAMDKAMQAYQQANEYGVAEFASQATFRMGEIYRQLSADLMDSERPAGLDELALEQYEILLEEQAFPFEEKAIAIHEANIRRSWEGWYDKWIKESFESLANLSPARYAKREAVLAFSEEIF